MNTKILLIVLLLGAGTVLAAQDAPLDTTGQSFGIVAGEVSGFGISWRSWPGAWGFQLTGVPYASSSDYWISAGFNGLYKLFETRETRFFAYFGGAGSFGSAYTSAGVGGGVGMELVLFDHLCLDLQQGLESVLLDSAGPGVRITVDGGLFYRL